MTSIPKLTRVQKKGQVTIPIGIRQKLGLGEGDLVAFVETEHGVILVPQTVVPGAVTGPNLDASNDSGNSSIATAAHNKASTR